MEFLGRITLDIHTKYDIQNDIARIETILRCNIFDPNNTDHPLRQSAFIELMICLSDLLQKCSKQNARLTFTDDIEIKSGVKDITDLVAVIRNTVCHISSDHHMISQNMKATFNVFFGKASMKLGGVELKNDYRDDIAFFFGPHRIYLKRHIVRAFMEAKEKLLPLITQRQEAIE